MTFGRPSAIPEDYIRLDLPLPFPIDASPESHTSAETKKSANVGFFIATMYAHKTVLAYSRYTNSDSTLYRIMWSIIDSLYGQNLACGKEPPTIDIFGQLYAIEQRILQWRRSLSAPLCIISPETSLPTSLTGPEKKLCTILTLRYLNVHLLLHRPVLVKFFDCHNKARGLDEEDVLLFQVGTTSLVRCHESATKIIAIVHSAMKMQDAQGLFGAWWFTLYYSKSTGPLTTKAIVQVVTDFVANSTTENSFQRSTDRLRMLLRLTASSKCHNACNMHLASGRKQESD